MSFLGHPAAFSEDTMAFVFHYSVSTLERFSLLSCSNIKKIVALLLYRGHFYSLPVP